MKCIYACINCNFIFNTIQTSSSMSSSKAELNGKPAIARLPRESKTGSSVIARLALARAF